MQEMQRETRKALIEESRRRAAEANVGQWVIDAFEETDKPDEVARLLSDMALLYMLCREIDRERNWTRSNLR